MSRMVMTQVSATVPADRVGELTVAFEALLRQPMPDGLLQTELLAGHDDEWRIQTLWRDLEALDAMRAGPEPPAAPSLFRQLGAEPVLHIYRVHTRYVRPGLSF